MKNSVWFSTICGIKFFLHLRAMDVLVVVSGSRNGVHLDAQHGDQSRYGDIQKVPKRSKKLAVVEFPAPSKLKKFISSKRKKIFRTLDLLFLHLYCSLVQSSARMLGFQRKYKTEQSIQFENQLFGSNSVITSESRGNGDFLPIGKLAHSKWEKLMITEFWATSRSFISSVVADPCWLGDSIEIFQFCADGDSLSQVDTVGTVTFCPWALEHPKQ
jgi:hypothetical protein